MQNFLLVTIFVFSSLLADAQKNNVFADIGLSGGPIPGISATYNRKLTKHIGVGAGIQGYDIATIDNAYKASHQFIPAIYADIRSYLPIKKSFIFLYADLGMNIAHNVSYSRSEYPHNNGFYLGLGIGYFYPVTKRGVGPYISLKMVNDIYKTKEYHTLTSGEHNLTALDGTGVISLGVRF